MKQITFNNRIYTKDEKTGYYLNSTTRKELSEKKSDTSKSSSQSSSEDSGNSGSSGETNSQQSSDSSPDAEINPENLTAGSSSVTGNRGSENIGIAIFKSDKFCGSLTSVETICHLLIKTNLFIEFNFNFYS